MRLKVYIYVLLFFFTISVQAQKEYTFDVFTHYKVEMNNKKYNRVGYVNSKDQNYFLSVYLNKEFTTARLYDINLNVFHVFKVNQTENTNFDFIYLETKPINKIINNEVITLDFESDNTNENKMILKIFRSAKRKRPFNKYKLIVKPSDIHLFHAFKTSSLHPYELYENFITKHNILVLEAKDDRKLIKLIDYKPVSFSLKIPDIN